jgi:hypothetical protein
MRGRMGIYNHPQARPPSSIHLSTHYPPTHPPTYPPIHHPSIHPSTHPSIHPSIHLPPIYPSTHPPTYPPIHPPPIHLHPPTHPFIPPSTHHPPNCQSIHPPISLPTHFSTHFPALSPWQALCGLWEYHHEPSASFFSLLSGRAAHFAHCTSEIGIHKLTSRCSLLIPLPCTTGID